MFHETSKFWYCCPNKKACDWEQLLRGCDICEKLDAPKLRSIDDFNTSAAAEGSEGAPVVERLRSVLEELGVENELFNQVLEGMKNNVMEKNGSGNDDASVVDEVLKVLGGKLKNVMKSIAVE